MFANVMCIKDYTPNAQEYPHKFACEFFKILQYGHFVW